MISKRYRAKLASDAENRSLQYVVVGSGSMKWRAIDIPGHPSGVVVWGETQVEADRVARRIVKDWNR